MSDSKLRLAEIEKIVKNKEFGQLHQFLVDPSAAVRAAAATHLANEKLLEGRSFLKELANSDDEASLEAAILMVKGLNNGEAHLDILKSAFAKGDDKVRKLAQQVELEFVQANKLPKVTLIDEEPVAPTPTVREADNVARLFVSLAIALSFILAAVVAVQNEWLHVYPVAGPPTYSAYEDELTARMCWLVEAGKLETAKELITHCRQRGTIAPALLVSFDLLVTLQEKGLAKSGLDKNATSHGWLLQAALNKLNEKEPDHKSSFALLILNAKNPAAATLAHTQLKLWEAKVEQAVILQFLQELTKAGCSSVSLAHKLKVLQTVK